MSQAGIVVKQVSTGGAISSSSGEKKKKKNTDVGSLGGGRKKDYPLQNSIRKVFSPFGWLTCNTTRHSLTEGWRAKKKKKDNNKKKNPTRRHKHLVHLSKPFLKLVQKTENNSIKISQMTPSSILNGTLLISNKITIDWAKQLERFRLVLRDHFCRGVFFFRFRLKKQQHLQKDVDVKWARGWEKHEKEQTRQCVKYHRSLIWVLFLCLLNQNSKNSVTP